MLKTVVTRNLSSIILILIILLPSGCTQDTGTGNSLPVRRADVKSAFKEDLPEKYPAEISGDYSIFKDTMGDMTWIEIGEAAKDGVPVLMSTAVLEEHGPHMPTGIDAYVGYITCKLVKDELESRGINSIIVPPFYWGINASNFMFPGTFTVRASTMKAVLNDILASLDSWGFENVFNFITHGDSEHNIATLQAFRETTAQIDINARCVLSDRDISPADIKGNEHFLLIHKFPEFEMQQPEYLDFHAAYFETGLVASFFPGLVDSNLARTLEPTNIPNSDAQRLLNDMKKYAPLGYIGDPAGYDADFSRDLWIRNCKNIADAIEKTIKD
ncbi:creatininase family protein [candidate division KSB1 bacterium]